MNNRRNADRAYLKDNAQVLFALVVTFGFFFCIYRLQTAEFPSTNKDQLNQLIGVLGTIWTLQMQWFFGSSAANKAKDETISDIAKMPAPVVPVLPVEPVAPINIPNAETVTVKTESGDVTVAPKKDD